MYRRTFAPHLFGCKVTNNIRYETTDIKTRPVGCIPRIGNASRNDGDGTYFVEQHGLLILKSLLRATSFLILRNLGTLEFRDKFSAVLERKQPRFVEHRCTERLGHSLC